MKGMAAGIIAAGDGSRLAGSRGDVVKPLIAVAGRPLAHWVVDGLSFAGATSMTVLTNGRGGKVPPSLTSAFPNVEFDFITADTCSSFESFRLVALRLAARAEDFIISTVDALIPPAEVAAFAFECRSAKADAGLALTRHVDDEKPLWVDVDEVGLVTAAGERAETRRAVTCGLYYMTRAATSRLPEAVAHGRLRDFWAELVVSGARVSGVLLSKTLDVDRPEDLDAAEVFLTTEMKR